MPTKFCLVKAMVFPVVVYVSESWTVNKAELWRIESYQLWCRRRLLRVPWTTRRSNQSILKEVSPKYSSERLLRLKLQYFWPPDAKSWLIGKDPDPGKDWRWEEKGMTGWDGWMASLTQWIWVWVSSGSWWWTGRPGILHSMGLQRVRHDWATALNWATIHMCHLVLPLI